MKAKVKGKTGAYFEVSEVSAVVIEDSIPFVRYFADDEGNIYDEQQLEFLSDTHEEVTIDGWVARSYSCPRDLGLRVYSVKPKRYEKRKEWNGHGRLSYLIDHRLFPSVTWESEPKRVKITITPME